MVDGMSPLSQLSLHQLCQTKLQQTVFVVHIQNNVRKIMRFHVKFLHIKPPPGHPEAV